MSHHCHALGCKVACPPRWLMCRSHWSQVPPDLQREVYRAVRLRGPDVDETWAPWWRAQARAIHHVAMLTTPDAERGQRWLDRELAFADRLEDKKP